MLVSINNASTSLNVFTFSKEMRKFYKQWFENLNMFSKHTLKFVWNS